MKNFLSFDEFVNEKYQVLKSTGDEGFNPANTSSVDPTGPAIQTIEELTPGHEYVLTVDGEIHGDMIYQGSTGGVHIFNGEDKAHDVQFTEEEIIDLIGKGGISAIVGM
jgi:hypothetical protein